MARYCDIHGIYIAVGFHQIDVRLALVSIFGSLKNDMIASGHL